MHACCGRTNNDTDDERTNTACKASRHSDGPSENKNNYPAQDERVGRAEAVVEDDLSISNHLGLQQTHRGSMSEKFKDQELTRPQLSQVDVLQETPQATTWMLPTRTVARLDIGIH